VAQSIQRPSLGLARGGNGRQQGPLPIGRDLAETTAPPRGPRRKNRVVAALVEGR
jgi:hypothetical protein